MAKEVQDTFEVRTVTDSSTYLKTHCLEKEHWLLEANWFPAVDDIELFLAIDPTSIHVGELNGKPIAIKGMFKYENNYRHFGVYTVDEAYRGKGFGLKLTAEVRKRSEPIGIMSCYSVLEMVEAYKKVYNAVSHWPIEKRMVDIPKAITLMNDNSGTTSLGFEIKRVSEVDMQALCDYDTKIFGYNREKFVQRLVQVGHTRVAVNQQQEIVGYAVGRVLYNPDGGYKVGPVFSESFEIAKYLLKEIFQEIAESGKCSRKTVAIAFIDPDRNEVAKFLGGEFMRRYMFMTTNGLPRSDFKKCFAVTTLEAG